ncbi:hypothetical protein BGZ60DRAFT_394976 [Tricladium varicosporioides]|nr:hypothetical protein BGZ60DRAFT_394976 [Hymenoscyphus varicosporioides]
MSGKSKKLQGAFSDAQERGQIGSHKRRIIEQEHYRGSRVDYNLTEDERELLIELRSFVSEDLYRRVFAENNSRNDWIISECSSFYSRSENKGDNEKMEEEDMHTYEEKLETWKEFFNDGAFMRYWDKEDENDIIGEPCLNRPFEEARTNATDMKYMKKRGELMVRAFWGNVRATLRVDDDEIYDKWSYLEEPVHDS